MRLGQRLALGALAVLAMASVGHSQADPVRLGLFIGIDEYPRIEGGDLDGCVNDVRAMHELFASRFGFKNSRVLLNEEATRQGIAGEFQELLRRVSDESSPEGAEVSVVLCFAGHGSRVLDQAESEVSRDEEDGYDETWVPYDSSWEGENDIRDDDLEALLGRLLDMGADVLLISDSCHSGSVHRSADFAKTRSLPRPEDGPRDREGPPKELIPSEMKRGQENRNLWNAPGFVSFTACADHQKASEGVDDLGAPCGRFSLAMRRVLQTLPPGTSYAGVFERVAAEFDRAWPHASQSPQFHSSAVKSGELFLLGGYAPPHARVIQSALPQGEVRLNQGMIHGVSEGSYFDFYESLDGLVSRLGRIGRGRVLSVGFTTCEVALEDGYAPSADAVAWLDQIRVQALRVHLLPGAPSSIRSALQDLSQGGQIGLADAFSAYDMAVKYDPNGHTVSFFDPAQSLVQSSDQAMHRIVNENVESATESLVKELQYRARVARLMSLSRDEDSVALRALRQGPDGLPLEPDRIAGIGRFTEGDRITLQFENQTRRRLFLHILAVEEKLGPGGSSGLPQVQLLYPAPGSEAAAIGAFEQVELARFRATSSARLERTTLKLIASSTPLDLYPLLVPPTRSSAKALRGGEPSRDPLSDLLLAALHGSSNLRGITVDSAGVYWSTALTVFEVAARP